MGLHDFKLKFEYGTSFCLENLDQLKKQDIDFYSKFTKIFNIFDSQKSNGSKGADGVLDKKELTYMFNLLSSFAQEEDSSVLDMHEAVKFVNRIKDSDGKTLRELGVRPEDLMKFLSEIINIQNQDLAKDLHDDIYARNSFGLPTTGKNIKENIKRINKDNVIEVLNMYRCNSGKDKQSLVSAICEEVGLSAEERAEMIQHIENCLLEAYESQGVYVQDFRKKIRKEIQYQKDTFRRMNGGLLDRFNDSLKRRCECTYDGQKIIPADGKVNETAYQGYTGDCWLVASINSIARSPKGKKILNDSIKVNKDGSVTVHLKGVNKTYTFSKQELYGSTELATGDMDVRALEKAVERYMIEEKRDDINDGAWMITAYKILLGESHLDLGTCDLLWDSVIGISNSYREKINDPDTICTASISNIKIKGQDTNSSGEQSIKMKNGQVIYKNHAYSVVRADNKYVYLINPWDGGEEIKITFEEFKHYFNYFADVTL